MNTECLFTVCSRGREHEHLGEQLVNSAAASVEQDRVLLDVAAADVLVQSGRPRRRRRVVAPGLQDDGRAREGQQRRRLGGGGGGKVDPLRQGWHWPQHVGHIASMPLLRLPYNDRGLREHVREYS